MSLRDEIKQTRPFQSQLEELTLEIIRTAGELSHAAAETLKPYEITPTQYNVLRILRGAGVAGLPCGGIAERMLTRDSDVTRLLDRLTALKLIERGRMEDDRRVVTSTLTAAGRRLLARLDPVIRDLHQSLFGHLDQRTLSSLIAGLERAREAALVNA